MKAYKRDIIEKQLIDAAHRNVKRSELAKLESEKLKVVDLIMKCNMFQLKKIKRLIEDAIC